jgi:protein involved in polysaccharide export with SLBB domain
MGARSVVFAVCLLASLRAAAQQLPDLDQAPRRGGSETGVRIPISASDPDVLGADTPGTLTVQPPPSLEGPIDAQTYVCGPGDGFDVNLWGQQNVKLRITADVEGRIFIAKVGYLEVAGKTLADVRALAKKRIRATYPGLQFDIALTSPRTFKVHVVNFVKQPGTYDASALERVSTVLARAGGATGSRRLIKVRHRDGKQQMADLVLFELTGDVALDPVMLDGDVVDVPPATTKVEIRGAVRRPGSYELTGTKDLREVVDLAGGYAPSLAHSLQIRIARRDEQQRSRFIDVPQDGTASVPLQDDDIVEVPSVVELQPSVLLIGAVTTADAVDAATAIKRLPYVEGDTVRSMIERAGGIRSTGDLARSYISRPQPNGPPKLIAVDLQALLVKRDFSADRRIQLNDIIVVPTLQYGVLVEGAVMKTGIVEYNPRFGVQQYLSRAGGRSRTARDLDDVKVVDPNGHVREYRDNLVVQPGDSIVVPERTFSRAEIAQLSVALAGLLLSGIAVTIAATR